MITTLRGHVLDRFMKFYTAPIGTPQKTLEEIQAAMISEFRKPKSKSQYITKIKEIKQTLTKTVWDFDQWFKTLMAKVIFRMSDVQHK